MSDKRYVEEVTDEDGFIVAGGYTAWDCEGTKAQPYGRVPLVPCGAEIRRYRGGGEPTCHICGQDYNAFGQRLRSDWRNNASNWDQDVSDMDGYESAHAGY